MSSSEARAVPHPESSHPFRRAAAGIGRNRIRVTSGGTIEEWTCRKHPTLAPSPVAHSSRRRWRRPPLPAWRREPPERPHAARSPRHRRWAAAAQGEFRVRAGDRLQRRCLRRRLRRWRGAAAGPGRRAADDAAARVHHAPAFRSQRRLWQPDLARLGGGPEHARGRLGASAPRANDPAVPGDERLRHRGPDRERRPGAARAAGSRPRDSRRRVVLSGRQREGDGRAGGSSARRAVIRLSFRRRRSLDRHLRRHLADRTTW